MVNPDQHQPADEARQTAVAGSPEKRRTSSFDGAPQGRSEKNRHGKRSEARENGSDEVTENAPANSAAPPPGIQLAPDVRLPLAALPIDFQTNEVTARMLDIIVADYYRDLAAGVPAEGNDGGTTQIEDNGETTIIVSNSPAAEAARHRADWRFRAIFGKQAFNRMSMQSNLEARLPVADAD